MNIFTRAFLAITSSLCHNKNGAFECTMPHETIVSGVVENAMHQ